MSKFELFCMIFLALDSDWDETHNQELGQFLSSANPFLFEGETSAVTSVYTDFLQFVQHKPVTINDSFETAKEYILHINIPAVTESFSLLDKDQWDEALKEYLQSDHKGKSLN